MYQIEVCSADKLDLPTLTWTPTFTNLAGGTLNSARYVQIGKTVFFRIQYTLAGTNVSGSVSFTPPVPLSSVYSTTTSSDEIGLASFRDTSAALVTKGGVFVTSTTSLTIGIWGVSGSNITRILTSASAPFTWASGDIIFVSGTYEAA